MSILNGNFKYCSKEKCQVLNSNWLRAENELPAYLYKRVLTNNPVLSSGPLRIGIGFDESCNLNCRSCYKREFKIDPKINFFESIFLKLTKNTVTLMLLLNGEALFSPMTLKWMRNFRKSEYPRLEEVILFTNGMLFNPKLWNSLSADFRKVLNMVHVSIDAFSEEVYIQNRHGGSFKVLKKNLVFLKTLKEKKEIKTIRFAFVVQKNNFHELIDFTKFAIDHGVTELSICNIMNWGHTEKWFKEIAVHLPEHKLNNEYNKSINKYLEYLKTTKEISVLHNLKR